MANDHDSPPVSPVSSDGNQTYFSTAHDLRLRRLTIRGIFSVMIVMDHVIAVITEKSTGCFRRHHLWRLSRVTRLAALMAA